MSCNWGGIEGHGLRCQPKPLPESPSQQLASQPTGAPAQDTDPTPTINELLGGACAGGPGASPGLRHLRPGFRKPTAKAWPPPIPASGGLPGLGWFAGCVAIASPLPSRPGIPVQSRPATHTRLRPSPLEASRSVPARARLDPQPIPPAMFRNGAMRAGGKAVPRPTPGLAWPRNQLSGRLPSSAQGLKAGVAFDPHQGMPTQRTDPLPEARTPQAPVGEHQHRRGLGNRWGQSVQQIQNGREPRSLLVSGQDVPGNGDGATSIEHAHYQGHHPITVESGVDSQSQLLSLPPGQQPTHQGGKTVGKYPAGWAQGEARVPAIIEPLPEVLAPRVPGTQGQQGGDHRVLAGATGQDGAVQPKSQAPAVVLA